MTVTLTSKNNKRIVKHVRRDYYLSFIAKKYGDSSSDRFAIAGCQQSETNCSFVAFIYEFF